MKRYVLVCCILKAFSVLCQDPTSDNVTLPSSSLFTSQELPQTPESITQPISTTTPSSTTLSPSMTDLPNTSMGSTPEVTLDTQVQCNYTFKSSPDNQTSKETVCVCPDAFISTRNLTCVKETDLAPTNITLAATKTQLNVTWAYKYLSPGKIHSNLITNISGNTSMDDTNLTFLSRSSSVPGQRISITITPVLNGEPITLSAASVFTAFKPAMPGTLIIPVGGYNTPNATILWNKSDGHVDEYQIHMTPLCPTGVSTEKFLSNIANVSVTGLKHGRKYRLSITAVSGNVTSDTRNITSITTNDIVPDPPKNVTILPSIQTTSVRLAIEPDSDVECSTIYYEATVLFRIYDDEEFEVYLKRNISVKQTNLTIDNLVPGAMYILKIFTKNRDFTSEDNFTTMFRTAESAPGNIQNIRTVNKNESSVHVRFDRPSKPNGEITGYVLRISSTSQRSQAIVMNLTADFDCSRVQSLQIQGHNGTYEDRSCTTVYYDASLEFVVRGLLPFTEYMLTVRAHNNVGAGPQRSENVTTNIGEPHTPDKVNISNIGSNEVTVSWAYGRRTGPTNFSLYITDEILSRSEIQTCSEAQLLPSTSCKASQLKAYWKYSFVVIAKTAVSSAWSSSSETITTSPSRPGSVRNLAVEKQSGDDCTEDVYGVKWTEPQRKERHGLISKYVIKSSLPNHHHMSKPTSTTISNVYEDTETQYTVLFAKAGSTRKIFTVSVMSIIADHKLKSDKRTVTIQIPMCSPGMSGAVTAGVIILVLTCIIVITTLLGLLYKWNMYPCLGQSRTISPRRVTSGASRHIRKKRPFILRNVKQLVDRMKNDSGRLLLLEWSDLNLLTERYPTDIATLPINTPKNRYNNILPYDRSRVKLCGGGNDYINANYIPGFKFEREYIACQGPLPGTIEDFWQMVWEQDVPLIVMLTRCKEGNTVKCEQYWPENLHESETYGAVEVTRTAVEPNDEYVYSEFTIASADHEKTIKHFHFLEWPDFGAEVDCNVFLDFLFKVKGEIHDDLIGPIVVHCSAGVGRTGTYLAIEYLTEFVRTHNLSNEFDIFQYVLKLRQHRNCMVQAKEQYLFIHECLRELVNRQTTVENLSNDGLQMPSEEEYSEQLFDPEDKLMIEEDNDSDNCHAVGHENPSMTTEL
ncbi:tyrosine-protein phosphatase 10D-like isoform X2 [Mizuhopecten yessoensis]|uniref:tyrosine-protein phosphatase 10D-like isoform X2 n=1 Tax=Mizuhopecten yessoensis TaxID=6573 RepID=UPI000B457C76|nr:tyrosine-protein phosphatase 10D-like isoform X2 [Mizuhopecten yessoensis]